MEQNIKFVTCGVDVYMIYTWEIYWSFDLSKDRWIGADKKKETFDLENTTSVLRIKKILEIKTTQINTI